MALNLLMKHADYFEDWTIQVKSGMNNVINKLTNENLRVVLNEISPWKYQIYKNLFPSIKRRHSHLELHESRLRNEFISSFWCWQLLTKPLDGYFFNMKIERKIINQGAIPVNIVCTAAEENYFAICTAETVFIYRIDNIKSPIYQTDFGLGSINKSIHFYQNDGKLKFGEWSETESRMEHPLTLERQTSHNITNKVTAYTIHANILFIGYENGFLQIFRINIKDATNLDNDESKLIKLSQDNQPITSICVSEFKDTLFIVATTARHFYPIKFIF
ncbi:hypothetical protein G9C98_006027 [Cotesia typhae]|uniref:Uncharacterized protein n=1 Tax=Cotesia typhae TaxID=2053667 RepID=A0A8J5UYN6_9HYME|nr:hypothetical protein G9C98_006027 [Cotesia typhae]